MMMMINVLYVNQDVFTIRPKERDSATRTLPVPDARFLEQDPPS